MRYNIQGGQLPVVVCDLDPNEEMFTESGGMSWMSPNISMNTNMEGGLMGGLKRSVSGESMFLTTYRSEGGPGMIAFASSFPGSIVPMELAPGQSIICQKSSFLAASRTVQLAIHFNKRLGTGLFGGEGFVMQRLTGPGTVFLEIDGAAIEYFLQPGHTLKVDTGHVAIIEPSVALDVVTVKGVRNVLFGGEGLFLTTLTGPGRIWLQSMPIDNVAKNIIPFLPSRS